jgi:hypothetical protein
VRAKWRVFRNLSSGRLAAGAPEGFKRKKGEYVVQIAVTISLRNLLKHAGHL